MYLIVFNTSASPINIGGVQIEKSQSGTVPYSELSKVESLVAAGLVTYTIAADSAQLPASVGPKTSALSLSVTPTPTSRPSSATPPT